MQIKTDNMCCKDFQLFLDVIKFFRIEHKDLFVIPYVQVGTEKVRVSHCPACGKFIRDVIFSKEQYQNMLGLSQLTKGEQ